MPSEPHIGSKPLITYLFRDYTSYLFSSRLNGPQWTACLAKGYTNIPITDILLNEQTLHSHRQEFTAAFIRQLEDFTEQRTWSAEEQCPILSLSGSQNLSQTMKT